MKMFFNSLICVSLMCLVVYSSPVDLNSDNTKELIRERRTLHKKHHGLLGGGLYGGNTGYYVQPVAVQPVAVQPVVQPVYVKPTNYVEPAPVVHHTSNYGHGGSYAGSSASAGSGGHGSQAQAQAQSQSASISVGPFSASVSQSQAQAHSGSGGYGGFDY